MGICSFAFYFPAPPSSVLERADLVLLYFLAAAYQVYCLNLLTATYRILSETAQSNAVVPTDHHFRKNSVGRSRKIKATVA
jgi:hypothetical protein